ncbi:MAG: dTMP kinase [Thermoplasmatales archaeon]|nr:dTMP kinase [Thermoplasmatales archaeon]
MEELTGNTKEGGDTTDLVRVNSQVREGYPAGALVVVEGIDGSGKSTQLHLLEAWLRHLGVLAYVTGWNSSELVKEITSKGKKKALLTPTTFSLLHATDFADRYERNVYPLLRAGYFVLADRYIYTAYARDTVRGCNPRWVRKMYDFATRPNVTFYFDVPVDVAVKRILTGRPKLKYYEAGMDMNLSNDIYESYRIFQSRIIEQYRKMASRENFFVMDGTLDIEEQQRKMRSAIIPLLPPEISDSALRELMP